MKKIIAMAIISSVFFLSSCASVAPQATTTTQIENQSEIATISTFEQVATDAVSLIALGNADVPVGAYSQEIFESIGIWEEIQSKISYCANVKEVLSQVQEGAVDCGMVYATDAALASGVEMVATVSEGNLSTPVIYPVGIVKETANKELAQVFLSYLNSELALEVFKKGGFTVATEATSELVDFSGSGILNVFAAASLTEALTEIQVLFNEQYPDITLVFNFDSSGTLKTQIESGAEVDIFFSAAQKQMNALVQAGVIDTDTVVNLLSNQVVLIIPGY
ncbi:MAG: molybdate ABC transporter substrate-binding protein [Anaerotignaceae bacterium]